MTRFIRNQINDTPIVDTVFAIVKKADAAKTKYGADKVVDATIGALYNEEGKIVAYNSVFEHYNTIANSAKAKYAASFTGNADYRKRVYEWLVQDNTLKLNHSVIATPGGSGAVSMSMVDTLDANETIILPEIAWGSYKLMASMNNINTVTYQLFDGDKFNIADFEKVCSEVMNKQGKVMVVINDPCHNPTGYSLSNEEWQQIVNVLNNLSKSGPVILLNDIAYIDYAYDFIASRKYLNNFNNISDQVMVIVAFSCSKTLTSYGLRCGAAVILAQQAEDARQMEIVMEKSARATWSNIPNAAMDNFVYVTTKGYEDYNLEKARYVALLKQRSDIFVSQADEVGLKHYPYKEGFFVTIKMPDNATRDAYHEALMANNIFTVCVNKGIRVAICSLSVDKCLGLAAKMKTILDETLNQQ